MTFVVAMVSVNGDRVFHVSPIGTARRYFAREPGREIVGRGHVLLGGCRTNLDAEVALAAATTGEL
jgi:hypothetical protein